MITVTPTFFLEDETAGLQASLEITGAWLTDDGLHVRISSGEGIGDFDLVPRQIHELADFLSQYIRSIGESAQ